LMNLDNIFLYILCSDCIL